MPSSRAANLVVLLALVGATLAVLLFGGSDPDDEEQVRMAIRQVAEAAEKADLPNAIEPISTTYRDADGLTRDQVKGYFFMEFRRRGPVHVVMSPIAVELLEGGGAVATFTAAVGEGGEGVIGELLPETGDVLEFRVELQKEGETWRVTSHERFDLGGTRVQLPID